MLLRPPNRTEHQRQPPLPVTANRTLLCFSCLQPLTSMRSKKTWRQHWFNAHGLETLAASVVGILSGQRSAKPNTSKCWLEGVGNLDLLTKDTPPTALDMFFWIRHAPFLHPWCVCGACVSSKTCAVRLVLAARNVSMVKAAAHAPPPIHIFSVVRPLAEAPNLEL